MHFNKLQIPFSTVHRIDAEGDEMYIASKDLRIFKFRVLGEEDETEIDCEM